MGREVPGIRKPRVRRMDPGKYVIRNENSKGVIFASFIFFDGSVTLRDLEDVMRMRRKEMAQEKRAARKKASRVQ